MKKLINKINITAALFLILLACNGRTTEEMLAKERAMNEIEEAKKAIDEYLLLVELNYKYLLDQRTSELSREIEELQKGLVDTLNIKETKTRIDELEKQREVLSQKMDFIKSACEGGCDDFSARIDQLFDELDQHLSSVDSILVQY